MNPQGLSGLDAGDVNFLRPAFGNVSRQEILQDIDILNAYFRSANVSPEQGEKLIQGVVNSGVKFKREDNTLMAIKPLPQNAAQVYFFSVDKPEPFTRSMAKLVAPLKQVGIQLLYMNKVDPTMIKAMQALGMQVQQSDRQEYKVMAAL